MQLKNAFKCIYLHFLNAFKNACLNAFKCAFKKNAFFKCILKFNLIMHLNAFKLHLNVHLNVI